MPNDRRPAAVVVSIAAPLTGEDLQADATVGEHGDGLHQVMQAAAQPVEFPHDEDITFA